MTDQRIRVTTGSRLHFGLLSFGNPARPQYGGAGVMVEQPGIEIVAGRADEFVVEGPLSERVRHVAERFFEAIELREPPRCRLIVRRVPRAHVGLGTGTQLSLAAATALGAYLEQPERTSEELATLIGRGRRSAIGTHGFSQGGLLYELGKRDGEPVSPLAARVEMPQDWRFVLFRPKSGLGLAGAGEEQAFEHLPPVPPETTQALKTEIEGNLLPAARAADFARFSESLYRYGHAAGTCFAELGCGAFATEQIAAVIASLRELGVVGVGQSSWGPTVFALAKDGPAARDIVERFREKHDADEFEYTVTAVRNNGATIERGQEH